MYLVALLTIKIKLTSYSLEVQRYLKYKDTSLRTPFGT